MTPPRNRDLSGRLRELTRIAVGASRNGKRFSVWRQGAVALGAGVFMAVGGPFGTFAAPLGVRLVYWVSLLIVGTLISNLMLRFALRMDLFERRPWTWAVLVTLVITPPMTLVVWTVNGIVFAHAVRLADLVGYALPVFVVSMVMLALTVLTQRDPAQTHASPPDAEPAAFLKRLPARLRGAHIYAVQAEDHYLRLHTSLGQDLILMRLSDALIELEGLEGAQVHRSWWVARDAVVGADRGGGRASLTLKSGAVAPVSRTYAGALRRNGWY